MIVQCGINQTLMTVSVRMMDRGYPKTFRTHSLAAVEISDLKCVVAGREHTPLGGIHTDVPKSGAGRCWAGIVALTYGKVEY